MTDRDGRDDSAATSFPRGGYYDMRERRTHTTEKLEMPPIGIPHPFYGRRALAGDAVCAVVAASGHDEHAAQTIITNLRRLGWSLIHHAH